MNRVYYNEIDEYCCNWLCNLMAEGLIPEGDVDQRSIRDVDPRDLRGYTQCHFFAGLGGWAYALQLAGWGDREVWTGSCPCQKLSSAVRGNPRAEDMWPEFRRLIAAIRPPIIFGEQVTGTPAWVDRLCDDVEALDYAIGAAILPALCVGHDHLRYRLYFACNANGHSKPSGPVNAEAPRLQIYRSEPEYVAAEDGLPNRMAQYSAYGNAIVPQVAATFVQAYLEASA